jgi:carboxypeptidase C (cathepsin A)
MTVNIIQRLAFTGIVLASLSACGGGGSSTTPTPTPTPVQGPTDQPYADPVAYSNAGTANLTSATEAAAITHHQITLGGNVIKYTATTGHLTAVNPTTGAPEATFFYVAYTADNASASTRPVTFFLSGGPGSSQATLHLGSFAPRRIVTNMPSLTEPTTPQLVDNQESLIDTTDMVFIDEVGAGYSEAIAPNTNASYWGTDADASVFTDFVSRYLKVNQRASSPLYLYGLSYGTSRGAIMSNLLAQAGVKLKGLVLNSSVLNFNTNCNVYTAYFSLLHTGSCTGELPSYAAAAAYYNLTNPAASDLPSFLQQVRGFDSAAYSPAVAAFISSRTVPSTNLISQLSSYTGISASTWQSSLDMNDNLFRTTLQPGKLIGLKDTRVAVPIGNLTTDDDPSDDITNAPYGNEFALFINAELKYTSSSTYAYNISSTSSWKTTHNGSLAPDLIPDLGSANSQGSALKILSLNGYYDLTTPFYQTELDLARLATGAGAGAANIQFKYYASGHDTFLDNTARPLMKADLKAFYSGG